jgi:hypothetical protein
MLRGACTRLERDARTTNTCRFGRLKQRINPHSPCKPVRGAFSRSLRSNPLYFYGFSSALTFTPEFQRRKNPQLSTFSSPIDIHASTQFIQTNLTEAFQIVASRRLSALDRSSEMD